MSDLVLGVDSSTQSCKVEVRTTDGELISSGSAPHPPTRPPSSEQPAQAWWDALVVATRTALDALPAAHSPDRIAALSVAGQCHGAVLLGDDHAILRPVKLWNDTTAADQVARLRREIGAEEWIRATGSLPTAAFTVGKLAWVADHEPDVWARTRTVLLPHDWLTLRLTGRLVTDRSEASGTGYYDSSAGRYVPEIIDRAVRGRGPTGGELNLPEVLGPDESAGTLLPEAAAELGLRAGIPIGPGGGDQHVSALGLGVVPGEVVYSIGTSGVVFTTSLDPVHDRSGQVDGVADATGHWLPLSSTLNAAKVADRMAVWLGVDHQGLGELADRAPATADRPVMAPFLDGERKPDLPQATGLLAGLTNDTDRPGLALAAVEGLVLGLVSSRDALTSAGVTQTDEVLVIGGGARLGAVSQVLADFDGRPVRRPEVEEAVARGACVQAAAVLAGCEVTDVRDMWRPTTRLVATPRPDRHQGAVLERYRTLAGWRGMDRA